MKLSGDRLALAFQRVFGTHDGERTRDQLLVLARLRLLARPGQSLFNPLEDDRSLANRCGRLEMWHEIDKRITPAHDSIGELLADEGLTVEEPTNE